MEIGAENGNLCCRLKGGRMKINMKQEEIE